MLALPASAAWLFLPAVLPVALWVAWSDMARMRIPNAAVLVMVGLYAVLGLVALPLSVWAWGWAHLGVVLVLGFLLNVVGVMGAGDAKFAAAMAPFIALPDVAFFLMLFAAVLLAAFATHRGVRAVPALRGLTPGWESWRRGDFPMGLALAGAMVFYLLLAAVTGG